MNIKKITEELKKLSLLEIFILSNPFIDLITSFSIFFLKLNITFGMIARFVFLLILLYYLLFKSNSKYKKLSVIYIMIVIMFGSLYLINMYLLKGLSVTVLEIKTLLKTFYFPILLVTLFNYFEEHKNNFNTKILTLLSVIYLTFILIPVLTNTSFSTYSSGKTGNIGWFYSPNEIGAILALLSPFIIQKLKNNVNKWYVYGLFALYVFVMLEIGTKVPFLGILLTIVSLLIFTIIDFLLDEPKWHKIWEFFKKPLTIPFLVLFFIVVFLYQSSSLNFNMNYHKQSLVGDNPSSELKEEDYMNLVFSSRDKYNEIVFKKFKLSNAKEQLFGMGYVDVHKQFDRQYNIVEIDYMDILYMYGILGFVIYYLFLFILIIDIFFKAFKNFKKTVCEEKNIVYIIGVSLIFGVAFFAGHVFTAPAVSIYPALIIPILFIKLRNNEKTSIIDKINIFVEKNIIKIICVILLIFVIFCFLSFCSSRKKTKIELKIIDNQFVDLEGLKLKNIDTVTDHYNLNVTDRIFNYEYFKNKVYFNIILVERNFENNDKLLMITIENLSNRRVNVEIESTMQKKDIKSIYNFKENETIKEFSTTIGYDKTTLPMKYIEYKNDKSVLISKGFKYKKLTSRYNAKESSQLKKLIEENENIVLENDSLVHNFVLSGFENYDSYLALSNGKLFNNEKSIGLYINMLNGSKYTSWLAYDGSYHKLPYSIEPFTREGYGRNPGSVIAKQALKNYKTDNSNIFYDLITNSNHTLLNYMPRDKSGVWITEYTSTWIKKDYDIRAPYIDTRHNEGIGNYLYEIGKVFNNVKIKERYFDYANYLVHRYKENEIIKFEEGFLFPDYFSNNHTKNTHSSLNHQLAIINYLLNSYIKTNNNDYKNLALSMLNTIEKQSNSWIRDDNDLWYQVNEENEYAGRDYKLLTLEDLLYIQNNLVLIGENKSNEVNNLIESKYMYLKNINYNIPKHIVEQIYRSDY